MASSIRRRATRAGIAAVTVITSLSLTVTPAMAATWSTTDPIGDAARGDISAVAVNNKQRAMVVTTTIHESTDDAKSLWVIVDPGRLGGTAFAYASHPRGIERRGYLLKIPTKGDPVVVGRVMPSVREFSTSASEQVTRVKVVLPHRKMAKKARAHVVGVLTVNDKYRMLDMLDTRNDGLSKRIKRG